MTSREWQANGPSQEVGHYLEGQSTIRTNKKSRINHKPDIETELLIDVKLKKAPNDVMLLPLITRDPGSRVDTRNNQTFEEKKNL